MSRENFKIIKGGIEGKHGNFRGSKKFLDAFVTDTRLMGVIAMGIHWEIDLPESSEDFHQFFYFDAEEYGLDTYESLIGGDPSILENIEQSLIGGLGGKKNAISREEAVYLLKSFADSSKKLGVSLPPPTLEYDDLLEETIILSSSEKESLLKKICSPILSDYHLIHYFLMRCFARDYEGASYLISGHFDPLELAGSKPATLCKNTIETYVDEAGKLSYLCEAVTDTDGKYEMIVLEISILNNKIDSAVRRSSFKISAAEAAMMLNRPEYISVYEILADPIMFDELFIPMMSASMQTLHDDGRLFMEFNKNNDHVNQKVFRLNEDIFGLYYVSDYGQLIIASYGLKEVHSMERFLQKSSVSTFLILTAKYEFKEPILYDFIQSDFEDFEEFLLSIQ